MLIQPLIDSIRQRLAQVDNTNTSWEDPVLIGYLNDAAKTVAMRIPWTTSVSVVGTGVSKYPLPSNCMTVKGVDCPSGPYYSAGNISDIRVDSATVGVALNGSVYAIDGRYIWFAPVLTNAVILRYQGYPADVTDTTDTIDAPATLRDCYINRVIADCLDDIDNPKAGKFEEKYERAIQIAEQLTAYTNMPLETQVRYPVTF